MTNIYADPIVVTGAAGGMGAAIARSFARLGHPLVLSDLHADAIEASVGALSDNASVSIVPGDITDPNYPSRIRAAVGNHQISTLVHAAGVSPSMADGRRVFEINFTATKALVEGLLPIMAPGSIAILIASNSGQLVAHHLVDRAVRGLFRGRRPMLSRILLRNPKTAYPFSKRAVQLYAQAMAPAFGRVGARIISLSPGIIDTEMGRLEKKAGPEMEKMLALTPLARAGTAEEIASVVIFLASPAASYINGTDILVDGGTVAGIADAGGVMKLR